jgi:hypothetical protein
MVEAPGIEPGSENLYCRVLRVCPVISLTRLVAYRQAPKGRFPESLNVLVRETQRVQPAKVMPDSTAAGRAMGRHYQAATERTVDISMSTWLLWAEARIELLFELAFQFCHTFLTR